MGGICTTRPEAVAWGPNRLDVFRARHGSRALSQVVGRRELGARRSPITNTWAASAWPRPRRWRGARTGSTSSCSAPIRRCTTSGGTARTGARRSPTTSIRAASARRPPEVVAWGPNRLDVFVLGTDHALYHKWWDGANWGPSLTGWEYLGGICASAPKVVAWGPNRLDIFVLGMDLALYHKWWDGANWGPVADRLGVHGRRLCERAGGGGVGRQPARRVRARHRPGAVPQVVGRRELGARRSPTTNTWAASAPVRPA